MMTPGLAKSRKELFWLPYPEPDRVIINAHNLTPSGPTLLGGEAGIWCPSLDDDGNGTTTLTDLVGSNNGTLVNFALTGSTSNWVADTGSGGVRAIALDGGNDHIPIFAGSLRALIGGTDPKTAISVWVNLSGANTTRQVVIADWNSSGFEETLRLEVSGYNMISKRWGGNLYATGGNSPNSSTADAVVGSWTHLCFQRISSTVVDLYVNGTLVNSTTSSYNAAGSSASRLTIGRAGGIGLFYFNGMFDDLRIFGRDLSGAEVAALASKRGY